MKLTTPFLSKMTGKPARPIRPIKFYMMERYRRKEIYKQRKSYLNASTDLWGNVKLKPGDRDKCVLCRNRIMFTGKDMPFLIQCVDEKGVVLDKRTLGICEMQYVKLQAAVKKAHDEGLFNFKFVPKPE